MYSQAFRIHIDTGRHIHTYTTQNVHGYTHTTNTGTRYAEKERDKKRLHLIICVLELDRFGFIKFDTDRTRDDDERKNDVKDGLC